MNACAWIVVNEKKSARIKNKNNYCQPVWARTDARSSVLLCSAEANSAEEKKKKVIETGITQQ